MKGFNLNKVTQRLKTSNDWNVLLLFTIKDSFDD